MEKDCPKKTQAYVGFGLSDTMVSISYCLDTDANPITVGNVVGGNKLTIPFVLCKRKGIEQWCYGDEAKRVFELQEGILVDQILEKCRDNTDVEIEGKIYHPVELLTIFLKKTLHLFSFHCDVSQIRKIVLSVAELDNKMITILEEAITELRIDQNKIYFQTHGESFYYYMINQEKSLIKQQVMLFEISEKEIRAYRLIFQYRTSPYTVVTDEYCIKTEGQTGNPDHALLAFATEQMRLYSISAVFLIGENQILDLLVKTKEYMCSRYRVFQGNNLFSKGACYSALHKVQDTAVTYQYLYLGKDMVRENIGMIATQGETIEYFSIISAGVNWYDANFEGEFILDEIDEIIFIMNPIDGGIEKKVTAKLDDLPIRPPKTTRIHMSAYFTDCNKVTIELKDLGFGDLFKSTNKKWKFEYILD